MTDDTPQPLHIQELSAGHTVQTGFLGRQRQLVIDKVSFTVATGEIVGLIGQNGSGKSTLLQAIVNPVARLTGEILIGGQPIHQQDIAYIPQAAATTLSPWLSVREEVALSLRIAGQSRQIIDRRVRAVMKEWGLTVPLERKVAELSGGQKVKVAILRALAVQNYKVFILDEPFEGLDYGARTTLLTVIRTVARRGIPVIITSHRAEDLVSLRARELQLKGRPVTLLQEKKSKSVTQPILLPSAEGVSEDVAASHNFSLEQSQRSLLGLFGIVLGLLFWQGMALAIEKPSLIPEPINVLTAMTHLLLLPDLFVHFSASVARFTGWWLLANVIAIPIGILLGYYPIFYRLVAPWIAIGRSFPVFVLVGPAIGLLPGYPEHQRGLLIGTTLALVALQSVMVATVLAPRSRIMLAKIFGATDWFCLTRIMPYEVTAGIFTALEVTLPLAVIITLVVETFLIPRLGLGLYVFNHLTDSDLSLLFAHVLWPAVLAAIGMWGVRQLAGHYQYEK